MNQDIKQLTDKLYELLKLEEVVKEDIAETRKQIDQYLSEKGEVSFKSHELHIFYTKGKSKYSITPGMSRVALGNGFAKRVISYSFDKKKLRQALETGILTEEVGKPGMTVKLIKPKTEK